MTGREIGDRDVARPSLVAALALCAGMVLARAAGVESFWAIAVAMAAIVVVGAITSRRIRFRLPVLISLFLLGGALIQSPLNRAEHESRAAFAELEKLPAGLVQIEGTCSGELRVHDRGATVWLRAGAIAARAGSQQRITVPLPVYLPGQSNAFDSIARGDHLTAQCRLDPVAEQTGSRDFDRWLASQGAVVRARAVDWKIMSSDRGMISGAMLRIRHLGDWMQTSMLREAGPREGAILNSMLLGRTNGLSDQQRAAFARTGLMHLFAVSGLHAGLIGALLAATASLFRLGPRWRAIIVILGLVAFCTLTGLRSSAIRASLLVSIFFLQPVVRRNVDSLGALATVAIALLLVRPRALWQLDFQLSFLCAFTLVLCAPGAVKIEEYLGHRLNESWKWYWQAAIRMAQIVFITLCLQVALAPIMASSLGTVSLISPIANMLFLPAVGLVMAGGFIALALHATLPILAEPLFWALEVSAHLMEASAHLLSQVPGAAIENAQPWPPTVIAGYYFILLSGKWIRLRPHFTEFDGLFSGARQVTMAMALVVWMPLLQPSSPQLRVTFFDVGQGDATFVAVHGGAAMLVDAGPAIVGSELVAALRSRGVEQLDLLVLTHADADHIGGAAEIVEALRPKRILVGGSIAKTETWGRLAETVDYYDVPVTTVRRGAEINLGAGIHARVLHPTAEFVDEDDERNEGSIVLYIPVGNISFLLTGDAETSAERSMLAHFAAPSLRCTVLKAGHHGSNSSTTMPFLAEAQPSIAVFSCGRNNRYRHPHPDVLARLNEIGSEIWRTDQQGTIEMKTNGRDVRIWSERMMPVSW